MDPPGDEDGAIVRNTRKKQKNLERKGKTLGKHESREGNRGKKKIMILACFGHC